MTDAFPSADVVGGAHQTTAAPSIEPPKKLRPRSVVPGEDKRQKFVRLVDPRVTRAIAAIRRIAKLGGNRSRYEWGQADVDKITETLTAEVQAMASRMTRPSKQLPLFSIEK